MYKETHVFRADISLCCIWITVKTEEATSGYLSVFTKGLFKTLLIANHTKPKNLMIHLCYIFLDMYVSFRSILISDSIL